MVLEYWKLLNIFLELVLLLCRGNWLLNFVYFLWNLLKGLFFLKGFEERDIFEGWDVNMCLFWGFLGDIEGLDFEWFILVLFFGVLVICKLEKLVKEYMLWFVDEGFEVDFLVFELMLIYLCEAIVELGLMRGGIGGKIGILRGLNLDSLRGILWVDLFGSGGGVNLGGGMLKEEFNSLFLFDLLCFFELFEFLILLEGVIFLVGICILGFFFLWELVL